jgi:preprotein translocase subunit YajC
MNSLIPDAMAQSAPAGGPAGAVAGGMPLLLILGMFVVMYFMLIRPQQKKQKEHQAMLGKLAAGDEVITAGGVLGRIVEVGDQFLTVEIAQDVRVKVQRFQVTTIVPKGTLKGA